MFSTSSPCAKGLHNKKEGELEARHTGGERTHVQVVDVAFDQQIQSKRSETNERSLDHCASITHHSMTLSLATETAILYPTTATVSFVHVCRELQFCRVVPMAKLHDRYLFLTVVDVCGSACSGWSMALWRVNPKPYRPRIIAPEVGHRKFLNSTQVSIFFIHQHRCKLIVCNCMVG